MTVGTLPKGILVNLARDPTFRNNDGTLRHQGYTVNVVVKDSELRQQLPEFDGFERVKVAFPSGHGDDQWVEREVPFQFTQESGAHARDHHREIFARGAGFSGHPIGPVPNEDCLKKEGAVVTVETNVGSFSARVLPGEAVGSVSETPPEPLNIPSMFLP